MKLNHIFLLLAVALSSSLFAQHNEEVTIEGTYRPKVNKVDKILMKPETSETSFSMPSTEIHLLDIQHPFTMELDKLTALTYNAKNASKEAVTENFLMAGMGTRISPVFLYKHHSKLAKNLALGVGIDHFSSWLNMKDYGPSSFMNNAFDVSLTSSRYNNYQLGGGIYYKNDLYHFYGFHPTVSDVSVLEDATRQTYNTIGAHYGVTSASTRLGEFSHHGDIDYHFLFDRFDGREHDVRLNYELDYAASWWGKKSNPQNVGMRLDFQYAYFSGYLYETQKGVALNYLNRLQFQVNPYFEMKDDFYRLHLGVNADVMNDVPRFGVYPDVKGSLFVMNKKLEFYAGLNGGRKLVTYSGLIEENPFLGREVNEIASPTVKLGFEGGFRTNVLETLDIHVGVRYRNTANDLFFYPTSGSSSNNPLGTNHCFGVVMDDTRLVSVLANVRWLAMDDLTLDAGFAYNHYTMTNLPHPWYRPATEGDLKISYTFDDKLALNAFFLYQGGRYDGEVNVGGSSSKMKDVFDLGLGADYKIKDGFTVFAKLDNVANQKYQIYYNYPVTGIQFYAGVKLQF